MAVAVVDTAGQLVVFDRIDSTQTASIRVAQDKATSAATWKRPTKVFQDTLASGGVGLRVLSLPGAIPVEGGLPVMGTTGERDRLAPSALALAARVKQVTDLPVLLGFGISTPEQAAEAAAVADGVIVGAAVMRRILDGAGPAEVGAFVASLRAALSWPIAVR